MGEDKNNASTKKQIRIEQQKGRLSKEEIDRIVKEAEKFKAEDEEKRARVDPKNQLENVLYQTQNQMGEKVPGIKEYIDTQITWVDENPNATTEEYQTKMQEVQTFIQQEMQKAGGMPEGDMGGNNATDM